MPRVSEDSDLNLIVDILVASHEEAILAEHIRLHEIYRVEKLFDLLFFSMSHSRGGDQAKQGMTSRLRNVNRARRSAKSRPKGVDGATQGVKTRSRSVNRASPGARNPLRMSIEPARAQKVAQGAQIERLGARKIVRGASIEPAWTQTNFLRVLIQLTRKRKVARRHALSESRRKTSRRRKAPNSVSHQFLQCFIDFERSNEQTR
jgi:hypothetical protein